MKLSEIGEAIGLATSTVSDLANGRIKAPGGNAAVKLLDLHRERGASSSAGA